MNDGIDPRRAAAADAAYGPADPANWTDSFQPIKPPPPTAPSTPPVAVRWQERAACRGIPIAVFYPDRPEISGTTQQDSAANAKAICATCPVTTECLDEAMRNNEQFGVWGGLTVRQRNRLRGWNYQRDHGTNAGYLRHRRALEQPCDRCAAAWARRSKQIRDTKKKAS